MHNGEGTNSEGSEHRKSANDTSYETKVEIKGKDRRKDNENSAQMMKKSTFMKTKMYQAIMKTLLALERQRMTVLRVLIVMMAQRIVMMLVKRR